jgi:RimJ/RimL family protein N-acetyltransferase
MEQAARRPEDPVETTRLVLTPIGSQDIDELVLLHSDADVAFWTGRWTPETTESWVRAMAKRWAEEGVGKWIAHARADRSLVGRGGFTRFDLDGEAVLELGWTVRDTLRRRGYATEIGQAALAWAGDHEPGTPIIAFTEVHNHASQAVMRRLGMRLAGQIRRQGLLEGRSGVHPDAPFVLYRL